MVDGGTKSRRFYAEAVARETDGGWSIALDGRPVLTPARATLTLPTRALAEAVAGEWRAQGGRIQPATMPLTGFANAAIDRIAPGPASFADGLATYAESDLVCYRADAPADLVRRQAAAWDPLLAWVRGRYDAALLVVSGVMHARQPAAALERLRAATAAYDAFQLAALGALVPLSGSLVIALALAEGAIEEDVAWAAAQLDDLYQAEKWGEDALAAAALADRRASFTAAVRLLALLREG